MYPVTKSAVPDLARYMGYVEQANARRRFSNFGPLHEELTARLEAFLGVENLLLVSNGTIALQIAYRVLGMTGRVVTSPFSFVATTATLQWEQLEPVFADIDAASLNIDPREVEKRLKGAGGIVTVHVYGNPCEVEALESLAAAAGVPLVYDAAHAFGARYRGESLLRWGDAATLSFHATKIFHTIEGGGIIFRKRSDFEAARELINFRLRDERPVGPAGTNAKLSEYHAAAGLALLDSIDEILERRAAIIHEYSRELRDWAGLQTWHPQSTPTGAYMPILLENEAQCLAVKAELEAQGIGSRRYFHPALNCIEGVGERQPCPIGEDAASRVLCLPLYAELGPSDVVLISDRVKQAISGRAGQ